MKQPNLKTVTAFLLAVFLYLGANAQNEELSRATVTVTITETHCATNATINVDMNNGDRLKLLKTATGACYVYTTNWDLISIIPVPEGWLSNPIYNDTIFKVARETNIVTININVPGGTGVEETGVGADFSVYPNPAREVLYIVSETSAVAQVLDVAGRLVYTTAHGQTNIDLSNFSAGVYYIRTDGAVRRFVRE